MTKEKMLEKLISINKANMDYSDIQTINEVINDLMGQIRKDNNKGNGKAKLADTMNFIISRAYPNDRRLSGGFKNNDYTCACNGIVGIMTKENVEVKMIDDNVTALNLEGLINAHIVDNMKLVTLPTAKEVKAEVKIAKAKLVSRGAKRVAMKVGDGESVVYVDAEYVAKIIEAFGDDCNAYIIDGYKARKHGIYFTNKAETTKAILMPISMQYDFDGYRAELL